MAKKKVKEVTRGSKEVKRIRDLDKVQETINSDEIKNAGDLVPEGRYQKILYDWDHEDVRKITQMAKIGLKYAQIAAIMDCTLSIFDRRIADDKMNFEAGIKEEYNLYAILEKARASGEGAIARTCYEVALEQKHPTMLIWLSKVRLGWRETVDVAAKVEHTIVYETQLVNGVINQDMKQLNSDKIIDAMIEEVVEEACPKQE
jgi:hypothetical protein